MDLNDRGNEDLAQAHAAGCAEILASPVAVTMSADLPGTPRAMARDGKMMMDTMMKRRPNVEFLTRPPGNQFCGTQGAVSACQCAESFILTHLTTEHHA